MQIAELIILGLLKEGEKHGYEIKQIIDERMALIAEITSGTVYYTLSKLQREGCVKGKRVKSGNRPEKNIYELTKIGEEKFKELLKQVLFIDERPYYSFDLALYFMKYAIKKVKPPTVSSTQSVHVIRFVITNVTAVATEDAVSIFMEDLMSALAL